MPIPGPIPASPNENLWIESQESPLINSTRDAPTQQHLRTAIRRDLEVWELDFSEVDRAKDIEKAEF